MIAFAPIIPGLSNWLGVPILIVGIILGFLVIGLLGDIFKGR